MTISIADLLTPVTADQQLDTFLSVLETLNIPARSWRAGGVGRTILRVLARTYAGFSSAMVTALGFGFLETAEGGWLVLLAFYVYGVTAIAATFASGKLTLTNTGGGVYTYGPREATFLNPVSKVTYVNTAGFTLNAVTTLTIDIEATVAGSIGSATPGTISALVTTMLGVTVSNGLSVIGLDAESDPDLRTRCLDKLASRSVRGPRNAYSWAVKSATLIDGTPVNINRVSVSASSSTGQVTVYCASPSGVPSADDLTAAATSIESNARPDGVTVTTLAVTEVAYTHGITIWAQTTPGVAASDVQTAAEKAIAAFIAAYPIGGLKQADTGARGLFGSGIASIIGSASPAKVFSVENSAVPGTSVPDLALVAGQVATDAVTVTVQMADAT